MADFQSKEFLKLLEINDIKKVLIICPMSRAVFVWKWKLVEWNQILLMGFKLKKNQFSMNKIDETFMAVVAESIEQCFFK